MNLRNAKMITLIIIVLSTFVLLYFYQSMTKLILISAIIAYMMKPIVIFMTNRGINKRISVLFSIILLFAVSFFLTFFLMPGMMKDLMTALKNMDQYGDKVTSFINNTGYNGMPAYLRDILDKNMVKLEGVAIKYLNDTFKDIIDFGMEIPTYILTPIFVYYFLMDTDFFLNLFKKFIPVKMRVKVLELGRESDKVLGGFIRSQIILSIIVAVLTFAVLIVFKVKYPMFIAFIGGITNIIPYFGPLLGLIPAVLSALTESVNKALFIGAALLLIQQLESSIIAPKLMGESIGIHPVFIMLALLIGGRFFGAWGLIFSIPAAGVLKVIWNYGLRNLY